MKKEETQMTHTSTEQPEALRLAAWLLHRGMSGIKQNDIEASNQLRWLHAESLQHQQELAAYRFTVANREARIAELESQLEAIGAGGVEPLRKQVAPPIAWPKDAQDVRDFFHADFITAQFAAEDLTPCDEDRYLISAHDFLSAVNWWADYPHIPRTPGTAPSAAPVPDERAAFEAWLGIKPCGAAHDFGWAAWQARAALAATQPAAQGVEQDAERWGEVLRHVGAAPHFGGQHFTLNTLQAPDTALGFKANLMSGSVAQHFTKAIDASLAAQAKQGGA